MSFRLNYLPFRALCRLTHEYALFYLQFIENKVHEGSGAWQHVETVLTLDDLFLD